MNDINDNKKFWIRYILFCHKIKSAENITLDKNDQLVRDKKKVTNIFNDFLST